MTDPLPLQDFGKLLERYQPMTVNQRARAVLEDVKAAHDAAESILVELAKHAKMKVALEHLRKNVVVMGKIRASEAKNALMEEGGDFLATTRNKLAAWIKTMDRIAQGEGISKDKGDEFIARSEPVAIALFSLSATGGYLSLIQLALAELAKIEPERTSQHQSTAVHLRRAATIMGDCEAASALAACVR